MTKMMSEGVRTFSTIENLILRTLLVSTISRPEWAMAQEAQGASGPRAQAGPPHFLAAELPHTGAIRIESMLAGPA